MTMLGCTSVVVVIVYLSHRLLIYTYTPVIYTTDTGTTSHCAIASKVVWMGFQWSCLSLCMPKQVTYTSDLVELSQ